MRRFESSRPSQAVRVRSGHMGSQLIDGLGTYIFNEKKYKKAMAEDGLCRALRARQGPRK